MRFKKLRFIIGISLIIFIFITGNIILFGELAKANIENKAIINIKNNTLVLVSIPVVKKANVSIPVIRNKPAIKHVPVIVHTKVRTRAS